MAERALLMAMPGVIHDELDQLPVSHRWVERLDDVSTAPAIVLVADQLDAAVVTAIKRVVVCGPVVVYVRVADFALTMQAFEAGALDVLRRPTDADTLGTLLHRLCQQPPERQPAPPPQGPSLVGDAPAMQRVFRQVGRLAQFDLNVLVTGETGTGKEVVARSLHAHSPRRDAPFVALNVAAIPADLLESELFGHERGAFTGADQRKAGRFEQAAGGTLFLDEIGDMPAVLQTRLLRVLAEGEFYRVGGHDLVTAQARIIAATHRDLPAMVAAGQFREDLLHRLNVVQIEMPPLRARLEDLPLLAQTLLRRAARDYDAAPREFDPASLQQLATYHWPGNIRELENLCRRLTVLSPQHTLTISDLPAEINAHRRITDNADWLHQLVQIASERLAANEPGIWSDIIASVERALIDAALDANHGNRSAAARQLGVARSTLNRKLD